MLHTFLQDKNVDGIRLASLAVGAVVFSALNVAVFGRVKPGGPWQLLAVFFGAALSLAVIVRLVQRLLLLAWARPVLGRWVYESSSGNWGLAVIDIHGGELRYSVQLYATRAEVLAAVLGQPDAVSSCFATVTSVGVTFHNGSVELIYKIDQTSNEYAPRSGMLTLSPLSPRTMKGYWKSDIDGTEANRGVLDMQRAETLGRSGD